MAKWFGSFNATCFNVPLPLCPLVGLPVGYGGVAAQCHARNFEILGRLVFMPSTLFIQLIALVTTAVIIWHIKSKYTAVGRKEMVVFFYLFCATTVLEFLLLSGAIPTASSVYPHFVAGFIGLICATFWSLLMNGLVGFQFVEDGTPLSLWLLRMLSLAVFATTYFIAAATFHGWLGWFDREKPVALWLAYYGANGLCVLIYVVLQIILVLNTLETRWPVGDIVLGSVFFAIAYGCMMFAARPICALSQHYVDGLFFSSTFNLLAALMVYKYWDSITKEDLEFSVAGVGGNWEVYQQPLLVNGTPTSAMYCDDQIHHYRHAQMSVPPRLVISGGDMCCVEIQ